MNRPKTRMVSLLLSFFVDRSSDNVQYVLLYSWILSIIVYHGLRTSVVSSHSAVRHEHPTPGENLHREFGPVTVVTGSGPYYSSVGIPQGILLVKPVSLSRLRDFTLSLSRPTRPPEPSVIQSSSPRSPFTNTLPPGISSQAPGGTGEYISTLPK